LSKSLARAAPVRFLIGVAAVWTTARGVALAGWGPTHPSQSPGHIELRSPMASQTAIVPSLLVLGRETATVPLVLRAASNSSARTALSWPRSRSTQPSADSPNGPDSTPPLLMLAVASPQPDHAYSRASGLSEPATVADQISAKRWSGSAWAFLRGGGRATALSPGQVGGGQAGARILYRLDQHLSAAARISTAIGGARQTEAAFGLDWKPIDKVPIHLMAERRVAIDRGGRNAWTLGAAGGVDDVRIAPGWRLDGYGEAGVVGARRRDLYADGAARIARAIDWGGNKSLALGGGLWGAAQPGASRLDVGPSVVLRLPVDHHGVAVALDWRERVLGHAKPGSGIALTVATDF
jgi:hypothetical protein